MNVTISDDLRQSVVIAKNEVRKFFSGKKILIFTALMGLIMFLLAALPYILGGSYDNATELTLMFVSFVSFLAMLAGVLFTATSIVSEYEERTALILFTRPIRKWAIFVGKLFASLFVVIVYMGIYYLFTAVYCVAVTGGIEGNLLTSFGLCVCAVFGITGLSMLLSSIAKKGSTASIMTLVALLLVLSIISGVLQMQNIDYSWMLNSALNTISTSVGDIALDPVTNKMVLVPANIDVLYNAGVMIGWGVVCNIIAFLLFRKRDF